MPKISELFKRLFINTYLKMAATVKYLPWRGSQAAIIFLASNIWAVNSGTVRALYCWLPLAVNGANPGTKKCNRGNGTMLVANFLKSALSWPGNRHGIAISMITLFHAWVCPIDCQRQSTIQGSDCSRINSPNVRCQKYDGSLRSSSWQIFDCGCHF